ncbi:putative transcription factor C2C2-YABBY family [Helianthus anomalus]
MFHTLIFVLKYVNVYAKYTLLQVHISISLFPPEMSTLNHVVDLQLQEQICYVQCGFCTTVLLVCVPYRCLSMVVTVKCGHCTSLFPVNLMRSAYFPPLHVFSSVNNQENPNVEASKEDEQVPEPTLSKHSSTPLISSSLSSHEDDEDDLEVHVVKKPPGKRQRAPSAYNKFIKEEIRRLKTQHPNMTHKQAFSAAAKNWAHSVPSSQQNGVKSNGSDGDPTLMIQERGGSDQTS